MKILRYFCMRKTALKEKQKSSYVEHFVNYFRFSKFLYQMLNHDTYEIKISHLARRGRFLNGARIFFCRYVAHPIERDPETPDIQL